MTLVASLHGSLAIACWLLLTAGARAESASVLTFANRPEFIAADTLQKFEAESGIRVVYDTYADDDALITGLRKGNEAGWDLVVTSVVPALAEIAHLVQPIGPIANRGNLDPWIMAVLAPVDPGNRLAVPYLWGTAGLAIDLQRLRKSWPEAPDDSLGLVFDPVLAARAAACGVGVADSPEDVVPAVLAVLGRDPASGTAADLAAVADRLERLKPILRRLPISEFTEALASGTICVGFGPSTAISDARTIAADREDGVALTYVVPRERARMWIDVLAIPANAPHPENARALIDFLLRPEIIGDITDWTGAANPNLLATDFVDDDDKSDETVFPSAGSKARLFLPAPLGVDSNRMIAKLWAKTKP
jgi:putrescine transport system substrate-binding protein